MLGSLIGLIYLLTGAKWARRYLLEKELRERERMLVKRVTHIADIYKYGVVSKKTAVKELGQVESGSIFSIRRVCGNRFGGFDEPKWQR